MKRALVVVGLCAYLAVLWQVVLTPGGGADGPQPASNLVPFASLLEQLDGNAPLKHRVYFLAGNLLMFTPPVVLTWIGWPRVRLGAVLLATVLTSGTIEVTQHVAITGRAGDIDDVILNTVGAAAATLLLTTFSRKPAPESTSAVAASQ